MNPQAQLFPSDPTALAAGNVFTLEIGHGGIAPRFRKWILGITFYKDAAASMPSTPTSGSLTVHAETENLPGVFDAPAANSLDLSVENETINWEGFTTKARVTGLSSVSGDDVTHFVVRVTGTN